MPRMLNDKKTERKTQPLVHILSITAIALAVLMLVVSLAGLLVQAFAGGGEAGIRSLAAVILPPIFITYTALFTSLFRPPSQVPEFNIYFIFTVWTTIVFIFVGFYHDQRFPLAEFALSITISVLIFVYKNSPLKAFLACCYGTISGFLIYLLLFGFPN
jgi:hypothetical protein